MFSTSLTEGMGGPKSPPRRLSDPLLKLCKWQERNSLALKSYKKHLLICTDKYGLTSHALVYKTELVFDLNRIKLNQSIYKISLK